MAVPAAMAIGIIVPMPVPVTIGIVVAMPIPVSVTIARLCESRAGDSERSGAREHDKGLHDVLPIVPEVNLP
jgi:hypothetical protein